MRSQTTLGTGVSQKENQSCDLSLTATCTVPIKTPLLFKNSSSRHETLVGGRFLISYQSLGWILLLDHQFFSSYYWIAKLYIYSKNIRRPLLARRTKAAGLGLVRFLKISGHAFSYKDMLLTVFRAQIDSRFHPADLGLEIPFH